MPAARNGNGINWGIWLSVPGALAVLVVAIIWIGSIGSRVSDHETEIREARSDVAEAFKQIGALRVEVAKQGASLAEIETQFCASDIVRNEEKSASIRTVALLWQKVFGAALPTDNVYYARICQPKTN